MSDDTGVSDAAAEPEQQRLPGQPDADTILVDAYEG